MILQSLLREETILQSSANGLIEDYALWEGEPFTRVYLKEMGTIL